MESIFTFLRNADSSNYDYDNAFDEFVKENKSDSIRYHKLAFEISEKAFKFTKELRRLLKD